MPYFGLVALSFDSRIGIASLLVGLFGIGITIVWPKKVVGWIFMGFAVLGGIGWGCLELMGNKEVKVPAPVIAPTPTPTPLPHRPMVKTGGTG